MREVQNQVEVCQYLVTNKIAYFEYVSPSNLELVDTDEENYYYDNDVEIYNDGDVETYDNGNGQTHCVSDGQTYDDGDEQTFNDSRLIWDDGEQTFNDSRLICDDGGQTYDEYESTYDNGMMAAYSVDDERRRSVGAQNASATMPDDDEESGYSKFCLEVNEVIEGTMCRVTGPTSLTLMITKIGGADLSVAKDQMYNIIYDKCGTLPPLDHIIPGMKRTRILLIYSVGRDVHF